MKHTYRLDPPDQGVRACVVIPVLQEAETIGACVQALARQTGVQPHEFEILAILSTQDDETETPLRNIASSQPDLTLHIIRFAGEGPGPSRRMGMELACARLVSVGRLQGLIATTDADSVVALDWLAQQMKAIDEGAEAIGGRIELSPDEFGRLHPKVAEWRTKRAAQRVQAVRAQEGVPADHWQFSGASIGITASAYLRLGELEAVSALEDEALERALSRAGIPIHRLGSVCVRTSGRLTGRSQRGLARDLELATWMETNTFWASDFELEELVACKSETVSLVLPTLNVSDTIRDVLTETTLLTQSGLIDEVLVVDSDSSDSTGDIARDAGFRVISESDAMKSFGPARGKGDAMWRALSETTGEVVVFVDTDTENFSSSFIRGLIGPLLTQPSIDFVKGAFRRPLKVGDATLTDEGGRVTELVARPLLGLYVPRLAGFFQPLAGETGARRELLESINFPVGYGVEVALLIDTLRVRGLSAMAQVDLGVRQNRHQPLRSLGAMAYAVMVAAERRIHGTGSVDRAAPGSFVLPTSDGLDVKDVPVEERPPMATVLQRRTS